MDPFTVAVGYLAAYLRTHLPPWLYSIISHVIIYLYAAFLLISDLLPDSLSMQSILPPVLSLLAIYMTFRAAYNSIRFAIRSGWFLLQLTAFVAMVAYIFGNGQAGYALQWLGQGDGGRGLRFEGFLDTFLGSRPSSQHSRRQRYNARTATAERPGVFDSFDAHRTHRERTQDHADPNAGLEDMNLQEVLTQVRDAWEENGRDIWHVLGLARGFTNDQQVARSRDSSGSRTRRRKSKKAQSRTSR